MNPEKDLISDPVLDLKTKLMTIEDVKTKALFNKLMAIEDLIATEEEQITKLTGVRHDQERPIKSTVSSPNSGHSLIYRPCYICRYCGHRY